LTYAIIGCIVSHVVISEEVQVMAKIVSKAFQLRKQLELKEGRRVPLSEVAERAGVDRKALTRLEAGDTERYDGPVLAKLCAFYGVGLEALLEYDPSAIRTLDLVGAVT
jgi:transcriptional regulator with XRE-family HTH domain